MSNNIGTINTRGATQNTNTSSTDGTDNLDSMSKREYLDRLNSMQGEQSKLQLQMQLISAKTNKSKTLHETLMVVVRNLAVRS